jgi:pimeloyl-ACP methyl ester carboxylesterase
VTTPANASGVAKVNGIELGYQVFGDGEPLVLLHGGFGTLEMFGPNVELLAAGRRVIGVELQSHGRSPAAGRPMRFEAMADDIAALIPHSGSSGPRSWASPSAGPSGCGPPSRTRIWSSASS